MIKKYACEKKVNRNRSQSINQSNKTVNRKGKRKRIVPRVTCELMLVRDMSLLRARDPKDMEALGLEWLNVRVNQKPLNAVLQTTHFS